MSMDDRELRERRLKELATRARFGGRPVFTRFLDAGTETIVRSCANSAETGVRFFGGYTDAERRLAGFSCDEIGDSEFPIAVIGVSWNPKYASPGHRDLLGSLMGLGIERDVMGDIVFAKEDGRAYVFVCEDIADYIGAGLDSVGRTRVRAERVEGPIELRESEGIELRVTVAAPRLDAILAAACKLSRGEAQKLSAAGLVSVNHAQELRGDVRLSGGDLLSVRGHGRLRVRAIDETPTKKGRLAVHVFRYT